MNTGEIIKKYSPDKDHGENVKKLSILIFKKILPFFLNLENYNNEEDLSLLEKGAMLHDIGISFEDLYDCRHHKAGARFIYENKPEDVDEDKLPLLCCLIRYHRKSLPKDKHKFYKMLSDKEKRMSDIFASIIRMADAMDYLHIGLLEDFEVKYDKECKLLTLIFTNNIMSNKSCIGVIKKKKDFFEKVFDVNIELKGN